jgi:hypothetical protein
MSFVQHLERVLDPALPLPLHIDLGCCSCSWKNGKILFGNRRQEGFRQLTRDELLQLMRRLQANPHVILLNIYNQVFGDTVMEELAAPIAALSQLQVLVLTCTRSFSTFTICTAALHGQHCRHRHSTLSIPHAFQ